MKVYVSCEEYDGALDEPVITVDPNEAQLVHADWVKRVAGGDGSLSEEDEEWQQLYEEWPGRFVSAEVDIMDLLGVSSVKEIEHGLELLYQLTFSDAFDNYTYREQNKIYGAIELFRKLIE